MKEIRLKVPDMSCDHCVSAVKNALEEFQGVEEADVSLTSKRAVVRVREDTETAGLLEAVRKAGYTPEQEDRT